MLTVACTLAQLGLSGSLSILSAVMLPVDDVDLALMKVKGYVEATAIALFRPRRIIPRRYARGSLSCRCTRKASPVQTSKFL